MSIRAYHVTDTGETVEVELNTSRLESLDAVLVLDDQQGDLWVLRDQLKAQKKFLVARTAANMNLAEGLRFRIRHVEPNERKEVISTLTGGVQPTAKSVSRPSPTPKPRTPVVKPKKSPGAVKETVTPLPENISTFFESFTRFALFESAIPKENLPPRTDLENRLNLYIKSFLDTLYA